MTAGLLYFSITFVRRESSEVYGYSNGLADFGREFLCVKLRMVSGSHAEILFKNCTSFFSFLGGHFTIEFLLCYTNNICEAERKDLHVVYKILPYSQ